MWYADILEKLLIGRAEGWEVRQLISNPSWPVATLLVLAAAAEIHAARPSPAGVAQRIDAAIASEVFDGSTELAPPADDATFLRRVYLDLVGDIPAPEQVIAFALDAAPDKRRRVILQLLDSREYGQNWALYWRDVVFFRAQNDRALAAASAMEADMARRLNQGDGWDEIAAEFVTARGDVREQGNTAIIMAQDARTEETTAEISRIFLGIQIQCAQCHDHPYDRWKREEFHQLAAFFPRVGVRGVRSLTKRSFEIYGNDRYGRRPPRNDNNNRPKAEHRMPDLEDPSAPGKVMQPKFFLTSASLPEGTSDYERRRQLANWLTENKWFAIALVNRIWSELVGEGFYEPVDDIGPDREATSLQAVELLARAFRESGYDVKWLMETVCLTEAYQRDSRPRRGTEDVPFTANVPQPLRSDQLFNALLSALEVDEGRNPARVRIRERRQFAQIFGYDPSQARDSISASIPQMLALMNSQRINRSIVASKTSLIKRLLKEVPDDKELIVELYLRCLNREPSENELTQLVSYRKKVGNRTQAFEDLLWALLNSAEFRHRR
ncbi:MAG: DUF1549 domain-containing protein [Pirellulales bacterium]|nr:DUF1549 domain-containing protein [Pirellulales bacterium]